MVTASEWHVKYSLPLPDGSLSDTAVSISEYYATEGPDRCYRLLQMAMDMPFGYLLATLSPKEAALKAAEHDSNPSPWPNPNPNPNPNTVPVPVPVPAPAPAPNPSPNPNLFQAVERDPSRVLPELVMALNVVLAQPIPRASAARRLEMVVSIKGSKV